MGIWKWGIFRSRSQAGACWGLSYTVVPTQPGPRAPRVARINGPHLLPRVFPFSSFVLLLLVKYVMIKRLKSSFWHPRSIIPLLTGKVSHFHVPSSPYASVCQHKPRVVVGWLGTVNKEEAPIPSLGNSLGRARGYLLSHDCLYPWHLGCCLLITLYGHMVPWESLSFLITLTLGWLAPLEAQCGHCFSL